MDLQFLGAADSVTGSRHLVELGGSRILLDCGLFQGFKTLRERNRAPLGVPPESITAVVLSHAHLDHSGNLPTLIKRGFEGNIFCTPPTRDLCSVMLRDAALIQQQDARYINKHNQRDGSSERVEPLFGVEDAEAAVARMISLPLHRPLEIAPGVRLTFYDAGHVLGSALVCHRDHGDLQAAPGGAVSGRAPAHSPA